MTSKPVVRRTLATLRNAEFGFFVVVVYTRVHTPRFCGLPARAGTLVFSLRRVRALRTSWLTVDMRHALDALNSLKINHLDEVSSTPPETTGRPLGPACGKALGF